jgi:hypothetical protein
MSEAIPIKINGAPCSENLCNDGSAGVVGETIGGSNGFIQGQYY